MEKMSWVSELTGENFLALCDVVIDIHNERQLVGHEVSIPFFQSIVKFPELLPADSSGLRDRYCELRFKAAKFLEKNGAVRDVEIAQGNHRWDSLIRLTIQDPVFSQVYAVAQRELKARFAPSAESTDQNSSEDGKAPPTPRPESQEIPFPERVSLRWLASHVPMAFWLSLAGSYIAVFLAGIKVADLPMVQQLLGIHSSITANTPAADVAFIPGDFVINVSSSISVLTPVQVTIVALELCMRG